MAPATGFNFISLSTLLIRPLSRDGISRKARRAALLSWQSQFILKDFQTYCFATGIFYLGEADGAGFVGQGIFFWAGGLARPQPPARQ